MATYAGRYDEVIFRRAGNRLAPPADNTTVLVYESDGSTVATLYTDRTKATAASNPVAVDSAGNLEFFAEPGVYVLAIREDGVQIATNTVTVQADPTEALFGDGASTASALSITDAGGYFTGTDVETALQELGASNGTTVATTVSAAFGDDSTDAAAHINTKVTEAGTSGAVYVPPGIYRVSVPIENVQRLWLAPGATIKASAAMDAVVRTDVGTNVKGGGIVGKGTIDGNNLAVIGVHVRYFERFEINGLTIQNATTNGVKLGDTAAAGRSAEANLTNLHIKRVSPLTVNASSRGINIENGGDHSLSQIIINTYDIGVYVPAAGGGMFHDIHVWTSPPQGRTTTCFEDHANLSQYVQCHADTPATYGFRFYGYQQGLYGCGTYNNPNDPAAAAADGTVVGIRFEAANSIATIVGHYFYGTATTSLAADVEAADGAYGNLTIIGSQINEVLTERARMPRLVGLTVRDAVTTGQQVRVDPSAPSNSAGLAIRTNGVDRWKLVTDGAAESGSNAGSGLRLTRHADDGTQLAEVFYIARTGTFVMKSGMLFDNGVDISMGSTTGTKIGTNSAQKIGFYGNTPVVKPAALPAIDATVTDTTWDATEKAVLDNTRQRLQNLEWRLQALGLLS